MAICKLILDDAEALRIGEIFFSKMIPLNKLHLIKTVHVPMLFF